MLGNGKQRKSYLYVQDCVDAMLLAIEQAERRRCNVFNLGTDEYCTVDDSLGWICDAPRREPRAALHRRRRGWIGDSPFIFLDTAQIRGARLDGRS